MTANTFMSLEPPTTTAALRERLARLGAAAGAGGGGGSTVNLSTLHERLDRHGPALKSMPDVPRISSVHAFAADIGADYNSEDADEKRYIMKMYRTYLKDHKGGHRTRRRRHKRKTKRKTKRRRRRRRRTHRRRRKRKTRRR